MPIMPRCLIILLLPGTLSCELINQASESINVAQPTIALQESTLVAHPSATDIAAHYCPEYTPALVGTSTCKTVFGMDQLPTVDDLQFHFELRYLVDNPNAFPILTTEILAKIDVFRGLKESQLGAVCAKLCEPGTKDCTAAPDPNSCKEQSGDIQTIDDLKGAVANLLVLTASAAINGDLENLFAREIPAGAKQFEVRIRFSLGIKAITNVVSTLVESLVDDALQGRPLKFEIPYSVGGTLWIHAPLLGRIPFSYGDFESTWEI